MRTAVFRRRRAPAPACAILLATRPAATLLACAALFALTTAQAQTASDAAAPPAAAASAAPADTALPVVVVRGAREGADTNGYGARRSTTALGLSLSRRETPQSVSVVTQAQMRDFGLVDVNRLLDLVPGVQVERVETDRTYYTARGFDIQTFQFDGIGMPFSNGAQWGALDTALFERVDVLRGANGLLTATGNPSATVDFVRKRPTRELQAGAALTLGRWNQRRLEADLSGALVADGGIRGRLIAVKETKDSYLDRYATDRTVLAGTVEADLGRDTRLTLGLAAQRHDADSPLWGALPLYFSDGTPTRYARGTSTAADWAWWNNTDRRAHAELTHELGGDWQLKASLLQRRLVSDSELFYVYGTPDAVTGLGLQAYPSAFTAAYRQASADLRASGPFTLLGRRHELIAGLGWGREHATERSDYGQGIGTALPDLAGWNGAYPKPRFDAGSEGSDWTTIRRSLYGAGRFSLSDALTLIAGSTLTQVESAGSNYRVAHRFRETAASPYLGVVARVDATTSAYASLTRIFNPQTEIGADSRPLDPIRGRSVEAGVKREWFGGRLLGSAALFRTRQANTAEAAGTLADGVTTVYRGVDATSTGFELELAGELAPGWSLSGAYTQFRLVDDDGHDARTFVPRRTLRMATSARLPGVDGVRLGGALRWQSAITREDGTATIRQAAYALVDLMASWQIDRHWSLQLNLDNATDRRYVTSLYWTQGFYGEPRKLSATLRWQY